ncbi:hypothetical protein LTSEMON_0202 [Salmonella enterica subsp. enterica serovar Montevideo str. S5-403]|uniref:Uncharacterized protein n=1 Tax=Salmonella enterica subsp. enterica serovar Montevideo str. S5-403 TaxID=913242 RepID=G5PXW6_SALMO|nr:hypothetical protein LTSEMON_0202 [Salmonella enterica subsp. enterica serovar Montevideo str. S5-403]
MKQEEEVTMHQFWLRYFAATEKTSWLACLSAPQRL